MSSVPRVSEAISIPEQRNKRGPRTSGRGHFCARSALRGRGGGTPTFPPAFPTPAVRPSGASLPGGRGEGEDRAGAEERAVPGHGTVAATRSFRTRHPCRLAPRPPLQMVLASTLFPSCSAFLAQEVKIVLTLLLPFSCGKIYVNFIVRGSRCVHNTVRTMPRPALGLSSPEEALPVGQCLHIAPRPLEPPVCVLCPWLCPPTSQSSRRCGVRSASRLRAGSSVQGVGPASGLSALERWPLRVACLFFARGTSGAVSDLGLAGGVPLGRQWSAHGLHAQRWDCRGHVRSRVPH